MKKAAVLTLLLAAFFSLKTDAQECCSHNKIEVLIRDVVQKAKENDKLKQLHLIYIEDYVFEEFNYAGGLKSTKASSTTISGKARKLAGFDLSIGNLLQVLMTRHDFSFSDPREINLNGNLALVIEFRPKSDVITRTTEDKFLNRLHGKLLVDSKTHSLLEVEGFIPESDGFSFRAWWAIFFITVDVKSFIMKFEQIEFKGIAVENKIEVETTFRVLGGTRTRKYHYQYRDYSYR